VNERDEALGPARRGDCHAGPGILHRAFSIYLFDARGQALLQRRSGAKRLWPLFWSNACCSHPRWGEPVEVAAHRRVREELGVDAALRELFRFQYHAVYDAAGSERELCSVWVGRIAAPPRHDEREIAELRFASAAEIDDAIEGEPERYTPWFRLGWERLRREHWGEIAALLGSREDA
jgi:isopentenyl-diphosphate delta-isomerase